MSKRGLIQMTPAEVSDYLQSQRTLNVATIGPNGEIHIVAMWFVVENSSPIFWTYATSQKIRNLQRDPRLSALVESGDDYFELRGVELVGRGEVITDRDEILRIGTALTAKYAEGGPSGDVAKAGAKRVAVRMHIDRVMSWDHSKLVGRRSVDTATS